MLKFYRVKCTTYVNGIDRGTNYGWEIITEEEKAKDYSINIDWNNIEDFFRNYASSTVFTLYTFKKGKYLSFNDFHLFKRGTWDIAEWRHPEMKIEMKVHYKELNPSIDRILHYNNGELAIQYLLERGINITKGMK